MCWRLCYIESSTGENISRRVTEIHSDFDFSVEGNTLLTSTSNVNWKYVYIYSQSTPGSAQLQEVNMISYVKMSNNNSVVDLAGLGGRKIYIQNKNYMNLPGSYFNESLLGN